MSAAPLRHHVLQSWPAQWVGNVGQERHNHIQLNREMGATISIPLLPHTHLHVQEAGKDEEKRLHHTGCGHNLHLAQYSSKQQLQVLAEGITNLSEGTGTVTSTGEQAHTF